MKVFPLFLISLVFCTFFVSAVNVNNPYSFNLIEVPENQTLFVAGNFTNLSQLLDTNIPTPGDTEVLAWDAASQMWIASAAGAGDNSSWNQLFANTLYLQIGNESNLNVNSSTWWANASGVVLGWFKYTSTSLDFNETRLNETIALEGERLGFNESTNVSVNFGANESDTSGPKIPFLLTEEGVLKIDATSSAIDEIWAQSGSQIININGNVLNITGNITNSDRIILGNGASIGFNSTCDIINYDISGNVISAIGCT